MKPIKLCKEEKSLIDTWNDICMCISIEPLWEHSSMEVLVVPDNLKTLAEEYKSKNITFLEGVVTIHENFSKGVCDVR